MTMVKSISNRPEDLADGSTIAPGEYRDIDIEDEHNNAILDTGRLIQVPDGVEVPPIPPEEGPAEVTTTPGQVTGEQIGPGPQSTATEASTTEPDEGEKEGGK